MITTIAAGNAILVFGLTALLVREWSRRRALEEVLRQSINYWRNAYEATVENREPDPDWPDDRGMPF